MFHSEPICILTAGTTVDGRFIEQKIIDDIPQPTTPKGITLVSMRIIIRGRFDMVRCYPLRNEATNYLLYYSRIQPC